MTDERGDDALVERLADLARLELSDAERASLPGHLRAILAHIECLAELDLTDVSPFRHGVERTPLRDDDGAAETLGQAVVCGLAPQSEHGQVRVPPVLTGDEEAS